MARRMWIFILVFLWAAMVMEADKLKHEVDKDAPFSRFLSYSIKPGLVLLGDERERMDKATRETLTSQLNAKGMKESSQHPDFYVNYFISLGADTAARPAYAVGQQARYDFGVSGGWGGILNTTVLEGELVVEIVDASNDKLAWRGIYTGVIKKLGQPEVQEQNLRGIVEKTMKPFPPKTGK